MLFKKKNDNNINNNDKNTIDIENVENNNNNNKKEKRKFKDSINKKYLKNGSYSSVMIVVFVAIIIVINMIVGNLPSKYTQLDISSEKLYTIGDETKAMLDAHPEITAIMCGNDQIAVGAITALNLAERKDIIVYGIDGSPDIKKELVKKDSVVAGTVAQSPIHMGKDAAKVALAILKDNEYEPETYEEVYMINSDNVEMYGVDGWQ